MRTTMLFSTNNLEKKNNISAETLAKHVFRLILTGTPMENRISERSSLLDWIKSVVLGAYWRLNPELTYLYNSENPDERGVFLTQVRMKKIKISKMHFAITE